MVTFQTEKTVLLKALKFITAGIKINPKVAKTTFCEVTIRDNKASFSIPGSEYWIDCTTNGFVKFSTNLFYLFDIIKSHNDNDITFEIYNDHIKLGSLIFAVNTSIIENANILKSIDIPINYNDTHLLTLINDGYTKEEIEFNNLQNKIYLAEAKLNNKIGKSFYLLKEYGVTRKDIEQLVYSKLHK